VKDKIIRLVQGVSQRTEIPEDDENLFDSGYLNSFELADLVEAIEKEFSIKIPDADVRPGKFLTVAKIEGYVGDMVA
jgi:acyl carrier protein